MNGPAVQYHDQHGHPIHPMALWHHRPAIGDRICAKGSHQMYEVVSIAWMSAQEVQVSVRALRDHLAHAA